MILSREQVAELRALNERHRKNDSWMSHSPDKTDGILDTIDHLYAKCAALEKVKVELEFIRDINDQRAKVKAPEDKEIFELCERLGYGAVMDSAGRQWRKKSGIAAHAVGSCIGSIEAALAAYDAEEKRGFK